MCASSESQAASDRWLLLIHQVPPKPDYLRVKVRRRLQRLAAVALKSTVYVLPNQPDTLEDFQWLLQEIVADGGEATVFSASPVAGATDPEIEALFRANRDEAYAELAHSAREAAARAESPEARRAEGARLRRRLDEIAKADFFDAAERADAERAIDDLERSGAPEGGTGSASEAKTGRPRGAVWVTREGVFVDRIASAWLIKRFIDPQATFRFVAGHGYRAREGELRFDMTPGEYTHEGDRCTFQTLVTRFALTDPALEAIAEIVHDIDLKDEKYGRVEAGGVAAVLGGIARAHPADADRIAAGAAVFEGLHAQLSRHGG